MRVPRLRHVGHYQGRGNRVIEISTLLGCLGELLLEWLEERSSLGVHALQEVITNLLLLLVGTFVWLGLYRPLHRLRQLRLCLAALERVPLGQRFKRLAILRRL